MHAEITTAHKKRLHHLKVQAALHGFSTPPEILMEIEHIEGLLKKVNPI